MHLGRWDSNFELALEQSPLVETLNCGNFDEAINLLSKNPHYARLRGRQQGRGSLPLHDALKFNPPTMLVKMLVEAYPEAAFVPDSGGWLPLHHAVQYGASVEVVSIIIDANIDALFVRDNCGNVPQDRARVYPAPPEVVVVLQDAMDAHRASWKQRFKDLEEFKQQRYNYLKDLEDQIDQELIVKKKELLVKAAQRYQECGDAMALAGKLVGSSQSQTSIIVEGGSNTTRHGNQSNGTGTFNVGETHERQIAETEAKSRPTKLKKRRSRRGGMWKRYEADVVSIPETLDEFR